MALNAKATQEFVPVKEIRDGIVILKNGDLRAIVLANSINLSLKSNDEQTAVILQFQNFLNTLDFPIQISAQSRRLDIQPYLIALEDRIKVQNEQLLKIQTREYINFIKEFTDTVSIMTKSFFVVIPYTNTLFRPNKNILESLFGWSRGGGSVKAQIDFEEKRSQLEERVGVIEQGLARCGINSAQLGTEEVIEVFYKIFNPGETEGKIQIN
ncbi:hypothetical protein A3D42_02620 [Candidatus Nomurabacteria bacterium RIFCSPHIGHO2_02_FULL_41_18]|uniref:TraC-like domain-containing protein n=1 Tax=Candidatus Nomurabacteria bacterium RIFCSPHIGHO2_02_FULL_41_18 TaxID=1801754 RepID=A0A1F6W520_9BACT|nr:MAG: hypothetical protein A2737_01095 [Candidatus Nomurabacteria bacterium RIFCSPHIGHO2_01_FULL_41_71]OGI76999.1 MAG: hypothetical protein A3D42_02620 [Candidatus Nomurabacteria bacterium RIFCSPHIGHO2_02_FULL_41_18]OGI89840.1 MAG: hypothetical protein A3B01_03535 [Candidatus Nomurabacteria bacterium RIFCSPLOWO2_01_FULL_41_52b]OGJ00020.1 MAG: hypothetical protein A3I90_02390 [Candidatus Nomurabacteria bacterium RIFCSPLOWO2_02_FULL_41_9]